MSVRRRRHQEIGVFSTLLTLNSTLCLVRPHRLARPRTPAFHAGDTGSNPVGDAISFSAVGQLEQFVPDAFEIGAAGHEPF